jgi:hypothetical protein
MWKERLETINTWVGLALTVAGILITAPEAIKHWRNRWPGRRLPQMIEQVADHVRRMRTSVGMIEPPDYANRSAPVAQGSGMAHAPVVRAMSDVEWLREQLTKLDKQRQEQARQLQENLDGIVRTLAATDTKSVIRDVRGIPIALVGAVLSGAPGQLASIPWLSGILLAFGVVITGNVFVREIAAWMRSRQT